jgi:putative tryptophan/tyrosine transport system substrate-binding protein
MKRREFIAGLGGAVACPLAVRAQQQKLRVIGFLHSAPAPRGGRPAPVLDAFRRGIREAGYVEGQNLAIEYRWAENEYDRLPSLVADLVKRQVALIAAFGSTASVYAAKEATASIPIVFNLAIDPQVAGFVASLARPGGNLTGVSQLRSAVVAKRLQMLHEIAPAATLIGVLVNRANLPYTQDQEMKELEAASRTLGVHLATVNVSKDDGIEPAIEALVAQGVGALLVTASGLFTLNNARIIALAARHRLPAIYQNSVFTKNGGLLSYGSDLIDTYHLAGVFAGRILNGERPAEMPVQQAVKIDMILNLKTARALGLTVPQSILLRADEVIE